MMLDNSDHIFNESAESNTERSPSRGLDEK